MIRATIAAASLMLLCAACGGPQQASADALRQARNVSAVMGDVEDRAQVLSDGLVAAITAEGTPEERVGRVGDYAAEHADEMHTVAAAIAEKFALLEGAEAQAYGEVMADRFAESTFAWRDAYFGFLEEYPDHADAMREAAAPLGPQLAPND